MTAIVAMRVRHRVRFAPNPEAPDWPTQPYYVDRRLIRDIEEFPVDVKYVTFDDVVETTVRLPSGEEKVLVSEGVNEDMFHVQWAQTNVDRILDNHRSWSSDIEVHPSLKGKVWIISSRPGQVEAQKALAA